MGEEIVNLCFSCYIYFGNDLFIGWMEERIVCFGEGIVEVLLIDVYLFSWLD